MPLMRLPVKNYDIKGWLDWAEASKNTFPYTVILCLNVTFGSSRYADASTYHRHGCAMAL